MPEISRFFGIVIRMFYRDHEPAHFHAIYGEDEALFELDTLAIYRGALPRRALALVLECGRRFIAPSFGTIGIAPETVRHYETSNRSINRRDAPAQNSKCRSD